MRGDGVKAAPRARFGILAVGTVLLALLTHIWFASTPLPFGGPNIALAFLAVLLPVILLAWASPRTALARVREHLAPILPVLAVAVSMLLWALAVYLATDTLDAIRLAMMALGTGVLFAVFVCVNNARRACAMAFVFVLATTGSALFGMAVVRIGDPFLGAWLQITNISQEDLQDMLLFGRNAGLAAHISTFGRQLAVAVPLALAALLYANYGVRPWHRRWLGAVFFVLLMTLVTAMLMNATRSVLVSVCLVSTIVAVPALGSARARRRLLVATPFATAWLLLYFNPVVGTGSEDGEVAPANAVTGDLQELAASEAPLYGDDPDMVGHMFVGNRRDTRYEVELRERYLAGYGQPSSLTVQADKDGVFLLSWRKRHDIVHYQYRLRPVGEADWPMWVNFLPALGRNGENIPYGPVALEGVVVGHAWPDGPPDRHRLRHRVYDVRPDGQYSVQLLPLDVNDGAVASHVSGAADEDGVIVLTWLAPSAPGVSGYRYRVREQHGPWRDWHTIETPNRMISSPEDALPGLTTGGESFGGEERMARVGHAFGGFVPWIWYVVQVRQAHKAGVSRLGEVTAKPDEGGNFVLAWQAPEAPKDVVGHAFRARNIADAKWSPWQDFTPSLTNRVPAITPVPWPNEGRGTSPPDAAQMLRHTLEGLSSGLDYRAQFRARNNNAFGVESAEVTFSADRDGTWTFAWHEPTTGTITGYQFRLWWLVKERWRPWQDFVPAEDGTGRTTPQLLGTLHSQKKNVEAARTAKNLGLVTAETKSRLTDILDVSTRTRLHEIGTVLRYIRNHPFGTGVYAPSRSHVGEGLEEWIVEELLRLWPHNQFLHVGVLFGIPGMAILVAFYVCALRPAIRCGVFARRAPDTNFRFLAIGVVGAWTAYSLNSLLIPTGPFVGGWSHFYLIGLLFAVERIIRGPDGGASAVGSTTP